VHRRGALALGSFLLDGHQRSMEPVALLMAADAVHLTAGAVWFAGLVLLVPVLRPPATDERSRSAGVATQVPGQTVTGARRVP
jgi:copper transport protein